MRIAERTDGIESLLIRHDKQDVGRGHDVILILQPREKNLGNFGSIALTDTNQRCFAPLNMTALYEMEAM
jgi:hypothetical protein